MVRNLLALLWVIVWMPLAARGQGTAEVPTHYLADRKLWVLETESTSYIVGINELNELQQVYRGTKITHDQSRVCGGATRPKSTAS